MAAWPHSAEVGDGMREPIAETADVSWQASGDENCGGHCEGIPGSPTCPLLRPISEGGASRRYARTVASLPFWIRGQAIPREIKDSAAYSFSL